MASKAERPEEIVAALDSITTVRANSHGKGSPPALDAAAATLRERLCQMRPGLKSAYGLNGGPKPVGFSYTGRAGSVLKQASIAARPEAMKVFGDARWDEATSRDIPRLEVREPILLHVVGILAAQGDDGVREFLGLTFGEHAAGTGHRKYPFAFSFLGAPAGAAGVGKSLAEHAQVLCLITDTQSESTDEGGPVRVRIEATYIHPIRPDQ
jgi:hypothetical protein